MTSPIILVSSSEYPEAGLKILRDNFRGQILKPNYNAFDPDTLEKCKQEILQMISGVDAVIWCSRLHFTKEYLDKAGKQLKIVALMSAGADHVDVKEIKSRGIAVTNTPRVLDDAVADMAILLLIGAARRVTEGIEKCRTGKWEVGPLKMLGQNINGSTVGIVGLGGIGQAIVKRLKGFGVKTFLYCGHNEKPEALELGAHFVSFEELLNKSDFVVLSCALNDSTKNMMNMNAFKKMKSNAILVNVSRGGIVNQDDLVEALKNKIIWAAGLDVMTPEPLPHDHPLNSLSNCFLMPHMGSATLNTRNEMAELASRNAILAINGEALLTPL